MQWADTQNDIFGVFCFMNEKHAVADSWMQKTEYTTMLK